MLYLDCSRSAIGADRSIIFPSSVLHNVMLASLLGGGLRQCRVGILTDEDEVGVHVADNCLRRLRTRNPTCGAVRERIVHQTILAYPDVRNTSPHPTGDCEESRMLGYCCTQDY